MNRWEWTEQLRSQEPPGSPGGTCASLACLRSDLLCDFGKGKKGWAWTVCVPRKALSEPDTNRT